MQAATLLEDAKLNTNDIGICTANVLHTLGLLGMPVTYVKKFKMLHKY